MLGVALSSYERAETLNDHLQEKGQLLVEQLSVSSEYALLSNNSQLLESVVNNGLKQVFVRRIIVLRQDGAIAVEKSRLEFDVSEENFCDGTFLPDVSACGFAKSSWLRAPVLSDVMDISYAPVAPSTEVIGTILVEIDNSSEMNSILDYALGLLLLWLGLFVLVGGFSYSLASAFNNKLFEINKFAKKISCGHLSYRLPSQKGGHEFEQLQEELNVMASALQSNEEALRTEIKIATDKL
jgi:nitrogen fixation/metabolism regulation signal transduction histidine kinase